MSFRNDDNFDSESYVKVNTRLSEFHAKYPNGRVWTGSYLQPSGLLIMKCELYRDAKDTLPAATGHAFLESLAGEKVGEFTETVAVGRALALMGFKIEKSIASGEEMDRFAKRQETKKEEKREAAPAKGNFSQKASPPKAPPKASEPKKEETPAVTLAQLAQSENTLSEPEAVPTEVKKLTTSRIFKPLPKQEQQQTEGK